MRRREGTVSPRARKRCLVVVQHLSHYRAGVYRKLQESAEWEFTFAAGRSESGHDIPEVPEGLLHSVIRLKGTRVMGRLLWQHRLLRLCVDERFNAVIFSGDASHVSTWAAAAITRLRSVPVLFWTIGWHTYDTNPCVRWLRKSFYRLADKLLLYGEDGQAIGRASGFHEHRMRIVGNSYASLPQESERADVPWEEIGSRSSLLVGGVARVTRIKRFDLLVEAVSLLRDEGMDLGVVLAGDGEATTDLEELAKQRGVPLTLAGSIYAKTDLERFYESVAVTVLPERAGLTVIQSLEHGVPVVTASDPSRQVPEFRAVVPGLTGGLYRPGEIDDLARLIKEWLARVDKSPESVTRACKTEVEANWSVNAQARRILGVLREVG